MTEKVFSPIGFPVKLLCALMAVSYTVPLHAATTVADLLTEDGLPFIKITPRLNAQNVDVSQQDAEVNLSSEQDVENNAAAKPAVALTALANNGQAGFYVVNSHAQTDTLQNADVTVDVNNANGIRFLVDPSTHITEEDVGWPLIRVTPKLRPAIEDTVSQNTVSQNTISTSNTSESGQTHKTIVDKKNPPMPRASSKAVVLNSNATELTVPTTATHLQQSKQAPVIYPNVEKPSTVYQHQTPVVDVTTADSSRTPVVAPINVPASSLKVTKKSVKKAQKLSVVSQAANDGDSADAEGLTQDRFKITQSAGINATSISADSTNISPIDALAKVSSVNQHTDASMSSADALQINKIPLNTSKVIRVKPLKDAVIVYPNVENPINNGRSASAEIAPQASTPGKQLKPKHVSQNVVQVSSNVVSAISMGALTPSAVISSTTTPAAEIPPLDVALKRINGSAQQSSTSGVSSAVAVVKPQRTGVKNKKQPLYVYPNVEEPLVENTAQTTDVAQVQSVATKHILPFDGSVSAALIAYRAADENVADDRHLRADVSLEVRPHYVLTMPEAGRRIEVSLYGALNKRAPANNSHVNSIWSRFDIRQALFTQQFKQGAFKVGIDQVTWGVNDSQRLVDIINQTDGSTGLVNPEKLGQPMINISFSPYQNNIGTFDAYVLPFARAREFGDQHSYLRSDRTLESNSNAVYEASRGNKDVGYAVRWEKPFHMVDVGVSYFKGTAREPLFADTAVQLAQAGTYQSATVAPYYYGKIHQTGLDLKAQFKPWVFKLEALNRAGTLTLDSLSGEVGQDSYNAVATGLEYRVDGLWGTTINLDLVGEYNYDSRGERSSSLYQNDAYYGTRWKIPDWQNAEIKAGIDQDLDYATRSVTLAVKRPLTDKLAFKAEGLFFLDIDAMDKIAMHFKNNEYLRLGLDYAF